MCSHVRIGSGRVLGTREAGFTAGKEEKGGKPKENAGAIPYFA